MTKMTERDPTITDEAKAARYELLQACRVIARTDSLVVVRQDGIDRLKAENSRLREVEAWGQMVNNERIRLHALAKELLEAYIDACYQGSGNEPLSNPTWHNFMGVYEYADELIPRATAALNEEEG
jgi:hypothetical protein